MTWNLQFPRAHFTTDSTTIEVSLGTRLGCSVSANQSTDQLSSPPPLVDFEIIPSERDLPINIDFLHCADAYVRESDLIALYPQQYPWPFGYQADFRYRSDLMHGCRAMELWLSVSTSMLACNPKLHLVPRTRFQPGASNAIAVAQHGRAALIMHPLDIADCDAVVSGEFPGIGQWDIFGGFMEKGVIRRARFLFAWSDAIEPESTWQGILAWFAESPLPLTA